MPHVEIKCFTGRTDEQKQICADRVADVIAETLGCQKKSVSVAIKDIPEKAWKSEVWDKHIVPDADVLYKKPGYTCEED